GKAGEHLVPQAATTVYARILRQVGDLTRLIELAVETDATVIGRQRARDNLEQTRFTSAVCAHQGDLGAIGDLKGNVLEDVLAADTRFEIQNAEHEQAPLGVK